MTIKLLPTNVFSIDSVIARRRGSNYLANMIMSMQTTTPKQEVITMLVRKDLSDEKSTERVLFLCEEDSASHIVQMYSGRERENAAKEAVFYKGSSTGDTIRNEILDVRSFGNIGDFLRQNIDCADAIASESKILLDQLFLCRAVHHMKTTNCTAREAICESERINQFVIELQRNLESAIQEVITNTSA